LPKGPIEIVIRSINHDGLSMLSPVSDGLDSALDCFGQSDGVSTDHNGLVTLRRCKMIVEKISQNMSSISDGYELGLEPVDLIVAIESTVLRYCSLLREDAQLIITESFSTGVKLANDGLDLIDACNALQNFTTKMISIGKKIVSSKTEPVSLETEFKRALNEVRELHLGVDFARAGRFRSVVKANRGVIYLLFRELLSNAFKYRKNSETLKVTTQELVVGGGIEFSILDNGIGIDSGEASEKIFQLGFRIGDRDGTAQAHGQGIGLTIVLKIVEYLGGKIRAIGELNEGTRFEVNLPKGLATR
jgi:signal transduction histidine kinase